MNVNTLIQQLQALVEQDAANGELPVLVEDGSGYEYVELAEGCSLQCSVAVPNEVGTYRIDWKGSDRNCLIVY